MKRKPRLQECLKRYVGKCLLCDESRYEALECHRVVPGCDGGKYAHGNVVVLCGNCHALVTAGVVTVHSLHGDTAGRQVARVTDAEGREQWVVVTPIHHREKGSP
mgnify:CR=1 FL=1